jgi:hypothetical protein
MYRAAITVLGALTAAAFAIAPAAAQAAAPPHSAAAPASAPAHPRPLTAAGVSSVYICDSFNQECLDGREGTGNVTVQAYEADGTHEDWSFYAYPGDTTQHRTGA